MQPYGSQQISHSIEIWSGRVFIQVCGQRQGVAKPPSSLGTGEQGDSPPSALRFGCHFPLKAGVQPWRIFLSILKLSVILQFLGSKQVKIVLLPALTSS